MEVKLTRLLEVCTQLFIVTRYFYVSAASYGQTPRPAPPHPTRISNTPTTTIYELIHNPTSPHPICISKTPAAIYELIHNPTPTHPTRVSKTPTAFYELTYSYLSSLPPHILFCVCFLFSSAVPWRTAARKAGGSAAAQPGTGLPAAGPGLSASRGASGTTSASPR